MADEIKTLADYMKEYYAPQPTDTLADGMRKFMEQAEVDLNFKAGAP